MKKSINYPSGGKYLRDRCQRCQFFGQGPGRQNLASRFAAWFQTHHYILLEHFVRAV